MWRRAFVILPFAALLPAEDDSPYRVEKLIGGLQYASSTAWARENYLLIADLPAATITKIDGKGPSLFRENIHAGGLAFDSEGRLLICDPVERNLVRIDRKGKLEVLADKFEGKRLNGPNSVVVSKNGHIWFTDPAFASSDKQKDLPWYGIYHLPPKADLSLVAKLTSRPNGIALSPDSKTLYVVDSDTRTVLAWDVDKSGSTSGQRTFARITTGVPNGVHAGVDGRGYVSARRLLIFTASGEPAGNIEIAEKPADITFGDSDFTSIYVAAGTSVYRVRWKSKGGEAN